MMVGRKQLCGDDERACVIGSRLRMPFAALLTSLGNLVDSHLFEEQRKDDDDRE